MAEEASNKAKSGEKVKRGTSNVFAMFNQAQIQEFKEAFGMIDQDKDGFISAADLKEMWNAVGRDPRDSELKDMLAEAQDPDKLNFTAFLNLFGERTHGTDPENTIRNAFKMFDEAGKGYLESAYVEDLLMNMGDNFTKDEIKQTFKEAPIEDGKFDYEKMTVIIKRGKEEE